MRLVFAVTVAIALLGNGAEDRPSQQSAPFVAIAAWYPAGPSAPPPASPAAATSPSGHARRVADLRAIKAAGFNSIRTPVCWSAAESERGVYRLEALQEILSAASETGLAVTVQIDGAMAPGWLPRRYADAGVMTRPGRRASVETAGYCHDHPGVRADIASFIGAAAAAAAVHKSFYAIDVWRNPGVSSSTSSRACYCPHTLARFRTALEQRYGTLAALNRAWGRTFPAWSAVRPPRGSTEPGPEKNAAGDWRQFISRKLQQDLKFRADASAPRGARPVTSHSGSAFQGDAWLMASVVDHYGTSLGRADIRGGAPPYSALALLDLARSAARERSWWVGALQAGEPGAQSAADLRLWAWAAIARGAGAIAFDDWAKLSRGGAGLLGASSGVRAAGEFAGVVGRNSGLFSRLRPRPATVAMLQDPDASGRTGGAAARGVGGPTVAYRALVDRNIPVDFIHPDEVVAGGVSRYKALFTSQDVLPEGPVSDTLEAFGKAGGIVLAGTTGESRLVPVGVEPEIGIDPGGGLVEARFLESADALVLVAMHYGATPRTVTFTFAPDVPEAIWQNLETGAAVSFVQSPSGPTYRRAFAPRDVLVLVRGKRLR